MAKKRSCRRTAGERLVHEAATKLRKMTDGQLMDYIDSQKSAARSEGYQNGYKEGKADAGKGRDTRKDSGEELPTVQNFLDFLRDKKVPGIGAITVIKLAKAANENGFT